MVGAQGQMSWTGKFLHKCSTQLSDSITPVTLIQSVVPSSHHSPILQQVPPLDQHWATTNEHLAEADQKLLIEILDTYEIKFDNSNYEKLARRLGCTGRAVQERIKKLRAKARSAKAEEEGATNPPSHEPIPVKAKKRAKRKTATLSNDAPMFPNLVRRETVEDTVGAPIPGLGNEGQEAEALVPSIGNEGEEAVIEEPQRGIKRCHEEEDD